MFEITGRVPASATRAWGWALLALFWAGGASAAPIITGGGQGGVTTDQFDVAQGATVLGNSAMLECCGGSQPENALGGTGGVEGPHTLFADGAPAGSVDFINFSTPNVYQLSQYVATLADDSDDPNNPGNPNRGSGSLRLYTSPDDTFTSLTLVSEATINSPYSNNYGTNGILVTDTPTNAIGQYWRLEVSRVTEGGPRIREFDGFGVIIPEPASVALLLVGCAGLLFRRRAT